jgi:hypothetical protein
MSYYRTFKQAAPSRVNPPVEGVGAIDRPEGGEASGSLNARKGGTRGDLQHL